MSDIPSVTDTLHEEKNNSSIPPPTNVKQIFDITPTSIIYTTSLSLLKRNNCMSPASTAENLNGIAIIFFKRCGILVFAASRVH